MRKGQEEAPIELLIGVTMLTFVIIIGLYIFQSSCSSQYEVKMQAGFSQFARDLESVYIGSIGTSFVTQVDFTQPVGCNEIRLRSINLIEGGDTACKSRFGRSDCLKLIVFLIPEQGTGDDFLVTEYINIPDNIIVQGSFGDCPDTDLTSIGLGPNDLCSFSPNFNNFRFTKEGKDKIVISDA